jgi:hypothetical protein
MMVKSFSVHGVAATMISAVLLAWASAATAQGSVILHVSPQGDDRNPGSAERPVRGLSRAQALVRANNAKADVTVEIAAGEYGWTVPWCSQPRTAARAAIAWSGAAPPEPAP